MRWTVSKKFDFGRWGALYERGRLFHKRDICFLRTREPNIGFDGCHEVSKMEAQIHFLDTDVYLKINFGFQMQMNWLLPNQ